MWSIAKAMGNLAGYVFGFVGAVLWFAPNVTVTLHGALDPEVTLKRLPVTVNNNGFLPYREVLLECHLNSATMEGDVIEQNDHTRVVRFPAGLGIGDSLTRICNFTLFKTPRKLAEQSPDISVVVTLRQAWVPWWIVREFRYQGAMDKSGVFQWYREPALGHPPLEFRSQKTSRGRVE